MTTHQNDLPSVVEVICAVQVVGVSLYGNALLVHQTDRSHIARCRSSEIFS